MLKVSGHILEIARDGQMLGTDALALAAFHAGGGLAEARGQILVVGEVEQSNL